MFLFNCPIPKNILETDYPKLHDYILSGEKQGLHLRYLTRKRNPWYKQEERSSAPIVFSYMGRKKSNGNVMKFFRNKTNALVTNAYFMLTPKFSILRKNENPTVFYDQVFQILTELDQRNFVLHGRSYGGGLYKIEPKELEKVVLSNNNEFLDLVQTYCNLQKM